MLRCHLCFLSHGVIHAATVVSITSKTVKKSVLGKYWLPFAVKSYLYSSGPFLCIGVVYVEESSGENILTLYYPVAACSELQACSCRGCTGIMRCLWTCQVKLAKKESEAVTSRCTFHHHFFCKVAVCVLLVPAASKQGNLYYKNVQWGLCGSCAGISKHIWSAGIVLSSGQSTWQEPENNVSFFSLHIESLCDIWQIASTVSPHRK